MARGGSSIMFDMFELCQQLKQEHLFIDKEREHLQKIYEDVRQVAKDLFHTAWIARQQKLSLERMLSLGTGVKRDDICARHNEMESIAFIDSYKQLSYHDAKYGELMKFLRENPVLLTHCILLGERTDASNISKYINILMSSIYSNCILTEDEGYVLQIIKTLIDLQLTQDSSPRRLLRKGNCAFSIVFKQFSDSIFSARLFLTAALHDPIMRLLMEDEWFYDIDPTKALVRFPPKERLKRFGEPGSEGHQKKLDDYRKFIVDKLVLLSSRFVNCIKGNIHCFPSSLTWLISHVYHSLLKAGQVSMAEVRATCADLVFALFICPAICDPEPYGITTDVPISHIAQHNLMQMAQIVQVLAVSSYEEIDEKVRDIYSRFEKGCMTSFIDALIHSCVDEIPSAGSSQTQSVEQSGILITTRQLNELIEFLRSAQSQMEEKIPGCAQLEEMLSSIPNIINVASSGGDIKTLTPNHTPNPTPPGTPSSQKKQAKGLKKKHSNTNLTLALDYQTDNTDSTNLTPPEDVLVIPLGIMSECPGMMTENKVLSLDQESRKRRVKYQTPAEDSAVTSGAGVVEIQEKRTRFSLSHDQESIGNTSDYQEVISEAASSHSVDNDDIDQDLEENDNDNLSDMMSANVSGRGSPSISGRDTPLSQAGSVEERNITELSVRVPVTVRKQNREDVTDRFGKFEIKTEFERDETKSTVSDTWSTDVLASDSEPPEQNQLERLVEVVEDMGMPNLVPPDDTDSTFPPSEISETASDAWSTDVLASDTEEKQSELTDLDQDDIGSITGRSEILEDLDLTGSEETPQASGGPSPPGEGDLVGIGAIGGPGRDQIATNKGNGLSDEAHVSDLVYNFNKLEMKKMAPHPSQRLPSDSLQTTEGRVNSVIHDLDNKNDSDDVFIPIDAPTNFGARPKEYHRRGNKTQMKNSDVALWARTNGINATESQDLTNSNVSNQGAIRTSVIKPKQLNVTNTTTPVATDLLIDMPNVQTDDTRSAEETDFDERRISAALSLFDPLSLENDHTDILKESSSSQAFGTSGIPHPLPPTIPRSSAPLLCVSEPSQDGIDLLTASIPIMSESDSTIDDKDQSLGRSSLEDLSPVKRRDSSDSNHSASSLRLNEGGAAKDISSDTVSLRSDDKDFYIEGKGEKSSKRGGIFRSLKDKIHTTIKKRSTKYENQLMPNGGNETTDSRNSESARLPEETLDDILDKYRKKKPEEVSPSADDLLTNQQNLDRPLQPKEEEAPPFYDSNNLEGCFAFQDAKRKLRLVLSVGDFQMLGSLNSSRDDPRQESDLIGLLRAQLAEAINLQNKAVVAQLHEVIRCVRLFDADGIRKLIKSLREEYRNRSAYISYLVRCRQGMLGSLSHLQRLLSRTRRDKDIGIKQLVNTCTRLFLELYEKKIIQFYSEFQKLKMADEKTDLVEKFLEYMYREMEQNPIWTAATENQIEDARLAIERSIMSRIYTNALFPNGDGDISRDQVFHQHIKTLSQNIKPTHRDLCIPRMYHFECPWPAAQREIFMINAYKTPKDKLGCVLRCSTTIMNLLSMANEKSVPAADDFIPVLIYVIIRANPPCLLSTIQYVQSFYDNRLAGEESYWWSQFSSAVEFIKTMEYSE
ncbi:hypothetical protein SNE40_001191 [Patella caerulea]|uniref:GTPase-activating protein and VPS9 domain-containing protein 1 n=1 Tax=Patella caerulea TaxID=87958 RepID=A0AAN8KIT8_PATCE